MLIVSHDRYFLNKVVTKVLEIELGELRTYMGNYSDYAAKKQQLRDIRLKEYLNQQQEIKIRRQLSKSFVLSTGKIHQTCRKP